MKLSVVIPVLNQLPLARSVYSLLREHTFSYEQETEFVIIDNGCDTPVNDMDFPGAIIVRNEKSIGVYPTFKQGFEVSSGDIVAFFHSDLAIWEGNWDERMLGAFKVDPSLGLLGFIGSNEIDQAGGRGLGTTSNFMGRTLMTPEGSWTGSPASVHGKESASVSKAAVVDGCAMIIRRDAWNKIPYLTDFPPHHFYDRMIACQILEAGMGVGVIGVACDHFSGYTTAHEKKYHEMAEAWSRANLHPSLWVTDGNGGYNWDSTIYLEAERRFLAEFRDRKHLVPVKIY